MLKKLLASSSGNKNGSSNIYMNGKEVYKMYQGAYLVYDVWNGRDFNYSYNYANQKFTFTDWKQTLNLISNTTHMIVNDDNAIVFDKNTVNKYRNYLTDIVIPYNVSLLNGSIDSMFHGASKITNVTIDSYNLTNMNSAFYVSNYPGPAFSGPNVTDMSLAFCGCYNLIGFPVCGPNVTNMYYAYSSCNNIKTAVCGDLVTNFGYAYMGCSNLTTAACGPNVVNMYYTYSDCTNLTTAACGPNTQYMNYTYLRCYNLKETAYSPKAWEMEGTYKYCTNLETACLYEQAYNVKNTFEGCISLTKCYIFSTRINNAYGCFANTNTSKRLDIYVTNGSRSLDTLISTYASYSITGSAMTWTNDFATNGYYYNTAYNIYIYPVNDVHQKYNEIK